MKAVVMNSFGGPEVLQFADLPVPVPADGEILIKVHAAGVNPVDYKIRSGRYKRLAVDLPLVPGRDVSGTVSAVGDGVADIKIGDEVFAFLASRGGGYADYAIARQEELAAKPTSLDHLHAAAVPLAAVTAWQALFDYGRLRSGQRVLIHGAGGGVGHFAVQLAKAHGAVVIATAGREDIDLLLNLGADQVIDYHLQSFEDEAHHIDLVVDLIGGETQRRSWRVLKDGGSLVSTLEQPSDNEAAAHHARSAMFLAKPNRAMLVEIARLIDAGQVRVVVQKTYELGEASRAQEELEHKHSVGKRVLVVAQA